MEFALLPPRPLDSHKTMFGRVGMVGGAPGMVGATLLAGRAALKCGAGLVTLGVLDESIGVDLNTPELMFAPPRQLAADANLTVLAIGPGLGQSKSAFELLESALRQPVALIIDADGLNCLAQRDDLMQACAMRTASTLLTPHAGEAARLLKTSVAKVQASRQQAAHELAARFNALVVLKGAAAVLARPDGTTVINETGNPALSAPGMGDVLTGMLAAFVARLEPWVALRRAVWLHGQAADDAVAQLHRQEGLTASELIEFARDRLNRSVD